MTASASTAESKKRTALIRFGKWAWGAITVLATVAGLYTVFHEKSPGLAFEVISESNVLDVHTPLPNLIVLFQGEDIQKSNLNLRLYRITASNNGEVGIQSNNYDIGDTVGIKVTRGRIIEARIVSTAGPGADYLKSHARPILLDPTVVSIGRPIMDRGASFTMELLVVHSRGTEPAFLPLGKVAGVDKITVSQGTSTTTEPSLKDDLLHASLLRHAARLLFYVASAVGLAIAAILGVLGITAIGDALTRRSRHNEMSSVLGPNLVRLSPGYRFVVDAFSRDGQYGILTLGYILEFAANHPSDLAKEATEGFRRVRSSVVSSDSNDLVVNPLLGDQALWREVFKNRLIVVKDGRLQIDDHFQEAVRLALAHLQIEGDLEERMRAMDNEMTRVLARLSAGETFITTSRPT